MTEPEKQELQARMNAACRIGDFEGLARLAMQAFDSGSHDEADILGWIAKVIEDNDLDEALCVIPRFVTQCPDSGLSLERFGEIQANATPDLDTSAHEAYTFLSRLNHEGGVQRGLEDPMTRDWVLQALVLLATSYCLAGARSYGLEVYAYGASLARDAVWKLGLEQAIHQVERDLTQLDLREANYYWCRFIRENEHHREIALACDEVRMPLLKQRMSALHDRRAAGDSRGHSGELFLEYMRPGAAD